MAINDSGLTIGSYPYALKYDGWYECYKDLMEKKQLKRGSAIVGRQFMGQILLINGQKRPQGFFFGPIHSPGTAYLQVKVCKLIYNQRVSYSSERNVSISGLGAREVSLEKVLMMTRPKTD